MKYLIWFLMVNVIAVSQAQDLLDAALQKHLSDNGHVVADAGRDAYFEDTNRDGQKDSVFIRADWTQTTMTALQAATTDPDVIALAAELDDERKRPYILETGLEVPAGGLLVLPSQTNEAGRALFVDDDGGTFTLEVHASPWKTKAEIDALVASNVAKRASSRVAAITKGDQAKSDAAAASSIPALRAAVVLLQEQIEEMQKLMGIRE